MEEKEERVRNEKLTTHRRGLRYFFETSTSLAEGKKGKELKMYVFLGINVLICIV